MNPYVLDPRFGYSTITPPGYGEAKSIFGLTPDSVRKALAIDASVGNTTTPIIRESLDPVIRSIVLNSMAYTPSLRRWKAYQAKAHLEQFARLSSLGKGKFGGSATSEGNLGPSDSSVFERVTQNMRWFGQVGIITQQAQVASEAGFGDLKKIEAYNRLTKLLLDVEYNMWHGDTSLNPLTFQGLIQQINALPNNQNVVSLKATGVAGSRTTITGGGTIDLDQIRARMESPLQYGGVHSSCWLAPTDKINLGNDATVKQRWNNLGTGQSRVESGITVDQIDNPLGPPSDVVWSIWMRNGGRYDEYLRLNPTSTTAFHPEAPLRMAAPTVAAAAGGNLPNDDFYYAVSAVTEKAEGGVGIQTAAATTTNTNGKVNITVTHKSDVANVKSYAIYRSTTAPTGADDYTTFRFLKEVAVSSSAVPGGTQVLVDDGTVIPGSRYAALLDESAISIPELNEPSMRDLPANEEVHKFSIRYWCCLLAHDSGLRGVLWKDIGGSVTNP